MIRGNRVQNTGQGLMSIDVEVAAPAWVAHVLNVTVPDVTSPKPDTASNRINQPQIGHNIGLQV